MSAARKTVAGELGRYVAQIEYKQIPETVIDKAKEVLLDQLGCMLIGSTLEWNKIVYNFVVANEGKGGCAIINYGDRMVADYAAYVNGTFGQGAELDDYVDRSGGHPGSQCIPVAMALGEKDHIDGKAFLTAVVAGFDVSYHVGGGMLPSLLQKGFHPQSVFGVFAAAAVAGRLLKLDDEKMMYALSIAGSHASGTMEFDQTGGEVKRLHTGMAVRGGMQAAILAKMGLTAPPTIFEGKRGILPLYAGEKGNAEAIIKDLGQEYGVMHSCFKQYPTVNALQSSIDVMSELVVKHKIRAADVERIDVGVTETTLMHGASIVEPKDTISASFSLAFSLAIRIIKGSNDLSLYTDENVRNDPEVLKLARKVHPYAVPEEAKDTRFASRIKVTLAGGKSVEGSEDYPKGSVKNPNTQAERYEKFRRLGSSVLSGRRMDQVIQTVENVEQLKDISSLVSLLVREPTN